MRRRSRGRPPAALDAKTVPVGEAVSDTEALSAGETTSGPEVLSHVETVFGLERVRRGDAPDAGARE